MLYTHINFNTVVGSYRKLWLFLFVCHLSIHSTTENSIENVARDRTYDAITDALSGKTRI